MHHLVSCWFRCLALCAATVTLPQAAHAEAQQPSAAARAAAKELDPVRRARQARRAGRLADALAALEAALAPDNAARMPAVRRAEALGELGLCELAQHRQRDAAEHLKQSLDHWTDLDPTFRLELQQAFNKAVESIGRVYFALSPPDAAVLLDGRPVGRAGKAYLLFVDPGNHTIRARLNGYKDVIQTFDIEKGQSNEYTMDLPRIPEAIASTSGSAPTTPPPSRPPPRIMTPPPPPAGLSTASQLRFTGAALAGTTAVVGATALVWCAITDGQLDARGTELREEGTALDRCAGPTPPAACSELRDLQQRRTRLYDVGWVSVATSGILGTATLLSLLLAPDGPTHDRVRVVPLATGQQAGLIVEGVW